MTDDDLLELHQDNTRLKTQMGFVLDAVKASTETIEALEVKHNALDKKIDKLSWIIYAIAAGVAAQIPQLKYLMGLF